MRDSSFECARAVSAVMCDAALASSARSLAAPAVVYPGSTSCCAERAGDEDTEEREDRETN